MTEDFLHFIWKFRLAGQDFHTTSGATLHIERPGEHNHDSGPDFTDARVRIDGTLWAGNVEIHIRSSDWLRHRHHNDEAYDSVILHVVHENDIAIYRSNGEVIPTLCLHEILPPGMDETYNYFLNNHLWIPCAMRLPEVREIVVNDWLSALSVCRLERKADEILEILTYTGHDWDQAFFQALSSTFGFRINKQPFELLARQTPFHCLGKHRDDIFQVEALLFGQAGLLERQYKDDYPRRLRKEYLHLKNKFSLKPVSGHLWKFMRLRPNNFPTIRLAQMAMLIHSRTHFFSELIETADYEKIMEFFRVGVSSYWTDHYYFDRPSKPIGKSISVNTVELVMINNVVPFLFVFGRMKGQDRYQQRALALLESIRPEDNSVIRRFAEFGIVPANASRSQALLELKTAYCDLKKCLACRIGLELIK